VEQLRALLYTDDLTGLHNRRFFRHCVAEQKTQSDGTGSRFSLVMMDVDNFKHINDTYGHAVGDLALIAIAKALGEVFREQGLVFRYAGDEFVGILRDTEDEKARSVCARILARVAAAGQEQDPAIPVKTIGMSIGFAVYPQDSTSISDLMELADRALYASKEAGRNCFHSAAEVTARREQESREWPIKVVCQSLIGRQPQWHQLQHYFTECRAGRGRLLLVAGEAGIGKSRLLRQFCKRQRVSDYHILYGECTEGTVIHSYAPIRDALRKGFEAKDPATVNMYKQLDENYRRELIALVPQFDRFERSPLTPSASADRYFLLESVSLLLQNLSRQLPTIMVLEDLHWSDEATLNLLHYLSRNIRNERILLIATFRDEEAMHSNLPAVMQNMTRENLFELIQLKPLNAAETGQMVQEIFSGYNIADAFKQWIHEETEGIPFYIEELIGLLLEEGYIERYGRDIEIHQPDRFILPYSIKSLIQRRINRLSESMQRVLGFASIIGYEFELRILARLIEENEGYLLDQLEMLAKMQFIREVSSGGEERFVFVHNKIRDVIYEDMGLIKRRKFHRRVGEILEEAHKQDVPLYAEDLAYHFQHGNEWWKACLYSLEAGKKALQIHDYRNALNFFDRCFQFKGHIEGCPIDKLAELYTNKGLALEALGLWDDAVQSYEQLLRMKETDAPPNLEADGLNHLSRVCYKREDFEKSLSFAERALELAEQSNYQTGVCNSRFIIGKNYWRLCNYNEALRFLRSALGLCDELNDHTTRAKLLNSIGVILLEEAEYEGALQSFHDAQETYQLLSDRQGVVQCLVNTSIVRHLLGDLTDARQYIVNAFAIAQEIGDPFSIGSCSANQADLEYKLANYELAARLNERAGRIFNEINHDPGLTYYLENEAHLQTVKGNLDAALEAILKAETIAQDKNLKKRTLELLKDRAAIHYFRGDYVSALGCLNRLAESARIIDDKGTMSEANVKLGFTYFALEDQEQGSAHWKAALAAETRNRSINLLFWRAAVGAFLASFSGQEEETRGLQNEMRVIAARTGHATLITVSRLLWATQFEKLGRMVDALQAVKDAEQCARKYSQEVWLVRVKARMAELQKAAGESVAIDDLRGLIASARDQRQSSVMHRCYSLLYSIDPGESLSNEWKEHWEQWKPEIPEAYHASLMPRG
jgi:diguanylate cyclase (GGDEF)-like protein